MMSFCLYWWRSIVFTFQYNPPEFMEQLMVMLAIALAITWGITNHWQYLVLSSSYAIGASISIWVREAIVPSPQTRIAKMLGFILLIYGLYGLVDIAQEYRLTSLAKRLLLNL
jgi:hypothetical protein